MVNTIYIIIFWILILFPILYILKIKHWNLKVAAVFVGRILLSIVYFINGMVLGLQRDWIEPSYETEWDFFRKSLLHGKTDAFIHLSLLIIIIILDLVITFYYINKKK
ncbi:MULTISPECIES: hypothetical protein [Bacillus cereus group]|uniref:Uncharacterized protein n=1 Tax=Bacillus thuringiensis TaxID=1428 RepID=A0A1C4EXM1_BACTU|nr:MULTISPECIES: hypothetical protein [Bacillus cereus group]MCC2324010.1 hypothetical protein [Bacillus wiedmannii]MED2013178.1 hypothetical protein [Bacillus wiedmannii]MED3025388.1 hypothetical protein [Bacillus wiedmannii]OTY00013.1 hypothetical protein BK729_09985 [Bacillus thuringiensis serovar wratislaviensis]OUB60610.1 hypothetical protein BK743_12155 [Bacillus thuringiensis serovar sylvestriensis]